jgi:LacI family transcriptional regulator
LKPPHKRKGSKNLVTQKEIAELAGVSRGTVDRVLNNRSEVSPAIQERVLKIADTLNYKPNRAAKSLVLQQKNLKFGCLIVQSENPFFKELIDGIEHKAKELESYRIQVLIHRSPLSANKLIEMIDELLEMNINGLIVQPSMERVVADKLKMVADMHIPIVTLNGDAIGFEHCYVGNDFYICGKTAANLLDLITGGTCKIGVITGFHNASSHADRINGFKDYIKERPDMQIITTSENLDDELISYDITKEMLSNHPEINALFITAGGVYGACRALKMSPDYQRIRVVSFDDIPTTKDLVKDGTISGTICQQPFRQGVLALEMLFDHFLDPTKPIESKKFTDIQIKLKSNIDV